VFRIQRIRIRLAPVWKNEAKRQRIYHKKDIIYHVLTFSLDLDPDPELDPDADPHLSKMLYQDPHIMDADLKH
jgi:hypothetical protein